jgi:hypothetical protein
MIVVAWNMGRRDHSAAWVYLLDTLAPDVALLQETVPLARPPDADIPFTRLPTRSRPGDQRCT